MERKAQSWGRPVGAVVLVAVLLAAWLRGGFGHWLFSYFFGGLVLLPLCGVFGIWCLVERVRKGKTSPRQRRTGKTLGGIVATIVLAQILGTTYQEVAEVRTRAHVAALVPLLDEARATTGSFPADAAALARLKPMPIFSLQLHYNADRDGYTMHYWDPTDMMGGYQFSSKSKTWRYFD